MHIFSVTLFLNQMAAAATVITVFSLAELANYR